MANIDNLYDYFKSKSIAYGKTRGEIFTNRNKEAFERMLLESPNSFTVRINGVEEQALIQDIYFNEQYVAEKHMILRYGTDVNVGDYVSWDGRDYLVLYKEDETIKSQQGVKILVCDNVLTWRTNDGEIVQIPTIVGDKTSPFSDGLNKTGGVLVRASDQVSALIQDNELTRTIPLNHRFIFDNSEIKVFRLTRIKALPSSGVLELVLKKDGYVPYVDNLELNIANYNENDNNEHNIVLEPFIFGEENISSFDDFEVYTLRNIATDIDVEWRVKDDNISLNKVSTNSVEVCVKNQKIFKTYIIEAIVDGEVVATKKINSTYM